MATTVRVVRVERKRGGDRWSVRREVTQSDGRSYVWGDKKLYISRSGAITAAANLALVHDPRYQTLLEAFNTERSKLVDEVTRSLEAETEPEHIEPKVVS